MITALKLKVEGSSVLVLECDDQGDWFLRDRVEVVSPQMEIAYLESDTIVVMATSDGTVLARAS